jgi:acyl carrier protein
MKTEFIEREILSIIKDVLMEDDLGEVDFSKDFKEQLEIDSMDFLDIIVNLKGKFDIDIPSEDFMNFRAMDSAVNYIEFRIKQRAA